MKERRDHTDELADSPELSKLKKAHPFKTPEGYFEDVEKRLLDSISEEGEGSSILDRLPKKDVFQLPEGYFEGVVEGFEEKRREESLNLSSSLGSRIISLRFTYGLAVAAAVALLLWVFIPQSQIGEVLEEREELALREMPLEDLIAEVDAESLSEDLLLSAFPENEFKEWMEDEGLDIEEMIPVVPMPETPALNNLIEELDVYQLEEELEELDFESIE